MRMARQREGENGPQRPAIQSIAATIGCSGKTIRNWVRHSVRDQGVRPGRPRTNVSGSRRRNGITVSYAKPKRSCARRRRVLRLLAIG
jgi:hypothetical protein